MPKQNHEQSTTFLTEKRQSTAATTKRPRTSFQNRYNSRISNNDFLIDPEMDAHKKMKQYKQEVKRLESQYVTSLKRLNESKKMIDKNYRDSQKTKVHFLNLFENRKMKVLEKKHDEQIKETKRKNHTEYMDQAKQSKLNREIRCLLVKSEKEESNRTRVSKNKKEKQSIRHLISFQDTQYINRVRTSYSCVRKQQSSLKEKKKKIEQMQLEIGKQNYLKKIGGQLRNIEQFDKVLNNINSSINFCDLCEEKPKNNFFLTQKKEIRQPN